MSSLKFKKGDLVRCKTEAAPVKVTKVTSNGKYLSGTYVNTGIKINSKHVDYFVHVEKPKERPRPVYSVRGFNYDWHLVGELLNGKALVQKISTGQTVEVGFDRLSVKLPYAIKLKSNGYNKHYFCKEGQVKVGDKVLQDDRIWTVATVGEKSSSQQARIHLYGELIHTTKIEQPQDLGE